MKRFFTMIALGLLLSGQLAQSWAYGIPKREFRSAWIATVWCLDWPSQGAGAAKQMAQMDRLLDSLQVNHFNAVNFQVRSMCDAMYKSSLEPWSSYLTGTRGADPGFDPLQYVVEGCHKRGMECHAWVNPYRWSTGTDWNTPQDRELKEDGWLLTHGNYTILDPGQQRTIDRIVAVCKEIITGYDVDGILYDDYFYPEGTPTDATAQDYDEWQQSGTSLSFGDWRRDNVNRMVQAVYDMIQETRPEVRYGISPAGVAATSSAVASQYGVEPCPSGSDWQYNGSPEHRLHLATGLLENRRHRRLREDHALVGQGGSQVWPSGLYLVVDFVADQHVGRGTIQGICRRGGTQPHQFAGRQSRCHLLLVQVPVCPE